MTHTPVEEKKEDASADRVFDDPMLQEMADAGVFFGRTKSKTHPNMRQYIFATRNNTEIIDLYKTKDALERAKTFLAETAAKGGTILFVGTRPASADAVKNVAVEHGFPYVIHRWLGGTLTNFKIIASRVQHLQKRKKESETGELEKYTKKERLKIRREMDRLEVLVGGLETMPRLPDAVVVVNIDEHDTAVHEARLCNIPVVGITGTSSDPDAVIYPIPSNDTARSSVEYLISELEKAVAEGLAQKKKAATAVKKEEKKEEGSSNDNKATEE